MTEWKTVKIGDLCNAVSETYKRNDEKVILINTSDVSEGTVLNHKPVPNENLKGQFKKTFKCNDILYSEIRPANKRFAFVDFDDTDNYIASTKLMVLRPHKDVVLPRFLYTVLKSDAVITELQHLAETRSGTFPQITFSSELAPMCVKIPDLETQKKISSVLSAIDDKIALNTAINKNLEEQAQAIFKSWFIDFEHFDGVMPDDWKISTLSEVSDIGAGGDKPKNATSIPIDNNTVPIYSNGLTDEGLYGFTNEAKIKEESVTVSARGTIGFVCLRQEPYVPIVRLITLIPKKEMVSAKYLYHWLKILHIAGTGTTQQQLTVPSFKKTEIIVPDYVTMEQFTTTVNPFYTQILANKTENQRLAALRDALLPKLMNGEIDVSEVKI